MDEEIKDVEEIEDDKVENTDNGTALVSNNQNGMGNICSPQP